MLRTLLVPLDGSEAGETPLDWALHLARVHGLSLTLARVVHFPYVPTAPWTGAYVGPDTYDQMVGHERTTAAAYLDGVRKRLADTDLRIETVVRVGDTANELLDLVDELGASAIVMATHGRGGIRRAMLGSIAEQIVRQATVPVLVVRAAVPEERAPALARVLIPLDGSPLSERAIDVAREIAPGATLILIGVVARVKHLVGGRHPTLIESPEATQLAVVRFREYLTRIASSASAEGVTVETSALVGESADDAATFIVAAADSWSADLIVMSTHGRTGMTRWRLGSVADKVVRHADRAVLLVGARALAASAGGQYVVADVMTRDVVAVCEDEPLIGALRKLARRGVDGAPVVSAQGHVVGVLSALDVLAWQDRTIDRLAEEASPAPADFARQLAGETVAAVMASPPVTVDESTSLRAVTRLLRERGVRHVPVTRDGQLAGIVTPTDLLRAVAEGVPAMPAREHSPAVSTAAATGPE